MERLLIVLQRTFPSDYHCGGGGSDDFKCVRDKVAGFREDGACLKGE